MSRLFYWLFITYFKSIFHANYTIIYCCQCFYLIFLFFFAKLQVISFTFFDWFHILFPIQNTSIRNSFISQSIIFCKMKKRAIMRYSFTALQLCILQSVYPASISAAHFPATARVQEIPHKSCRLPSFPSPKAFHRRYGAEAPYRKILPSPSRRF